MNPDQKTKPELPSQEVLKEVDKLNEELKNPTPPADPCALAKQLVEIGKAVDFDTMPEHSVVFIRLNTDNPMRFDALQRGIVKSVLEPRFEKLKQRKICILFVQAGEDITVMTEEEMGQAGWEKKDKKRIITI